MTLDYVEPRIASGAIYVSFLNIKARIATRTIDVAACYVGVRIATRPVDVIVRNVMSGVHDDAPKVCAP